MGTFQLCIAAQINLVVYNNSPLIMLLESVEQVLRRSTGGIVCLCFIMSRDSTGKTHTVGSWNNLEQGLATKAYRPNPVYHLCV